jgi:hypothetical protein
MIGEKFGRFTIIGASERKGYWICCCECGSQRIVREFHLKTGHTRSCGCLKRDLISSARTTHGHTRNYKISSEYHSWIAMVRRCYRPKHETFSYYGGRGITICDEWQNSFASFIEHLGLKPSPLHTLDRIDNSRGYEPGNVRWATKKEQMRNRRNNHRLTFNGETHSTVEWSEIVGIKPKTIKWRIKAGWTIERALTQAIKEINR